LEKGASQRRCAAVETRRLRNDAQGPIAPGIARSQRMIQGRAIWPLHILHIGTVKSRKKPNPISKIPDSHYPKWITRFILSRQTLYLSPSPEQASSESFRVSVNTPVCPGGLVKKAYVAGAAIYACDLLVHCSEHREALASRARRVTT
jgi:hypothetical protein